MAQVANHRVPIIAPIAVDDTALIANPPRHVLKEQVGPYPVAAL